jgi:DNA polymerase-3 subunit delta
LAALKPVYLIHGDDHGAVAERRSGLRALAERSAGSAGVEVLEGDAATPAGVARALDTLTLSLGGEPGGGIGRVVIVEGVERWREAEVKRDLLPVLAAMPPATTLALFAREEQRVKAPAVLHGAVERAGGQIVPQMTVKRWELPRWVTAQAARMGLQLDTAAAKALVAQVGERQQRLLRELEKLALEAGAEPDGEGRSGGRVRVDAAAIEERAARSAEWQAFALGDALVAGDRAGALRMYLRLREQGERPAGLLYVLAQRLREALAVCERLRAGESAAEVRRTLRMPARAADRMIAEVSTMEPAALRRALTELASLEVDSRGGAHVGVQRAPRAALSEDTIAVSAIDAITA